MKKRKNDNLFEMRRERLWWRVGVRVLIVQLIPEVDEYYPFDFSSSKQETYTKGSGEASTRKKGDL